MGILVSGANSGVCRYLHENLKGIGLTRTTSPEEIEKVKREGIDNIIHCAFNSSRNINTDSLQQYIDDNIFLTKELVSFRHKKFIFFSSVDVYPKNRETHFENEIIDVNSVSGIYAIAKLISEAIVKKYCKNYLILRATAFLGKYSRKNSLLRIIENKECLLTLSADSRFNYVLYPDILNFVRYSIENNLEGIYNLASAENISLSRVAEIFQKKVNFGDYFYDVGNINNDKVSSVLPVFKRSSEKTMLKFAESLKK